VSLRKKGLVKNKAFCLFLLAQFFLFSEFLVPLAFAQKSSHNLNKYKVELLPFDKPIQEKYQLKLIHPYSFRLKTIQKSLVALKFKKKNIFSVQNGRILNNEWVKRLAPLIQEKFSQANSRQRVAFEISKKSGATYIRGDTFLTSEGLHWRFTILRGIRWGIEDFSVSGEPWVLVLQKGQVYKKRYWKGSTQATQDIVNWVIFENISPDFARKLPEPVLNPSTLNNKKFQQKLSVADVKKRLHRLEQLREENVITKKEYVSKRREILDLL
jgi:hypothetical protein